MLYLIYLLCAISLLVVLGIAVVFNGLVSAKNEVHNSFTQIDVQLKRRHDLVPQLIKAIKGAVTFERETLEQVTRARYDALSAATHGARIQSEQILGQTIVNMMAIAENYPELKATQLFQRLQEELITTENRIGFSRQRYNDCVMAYDVSRQSFPGMLLASESRFPQEPYWRITTTAQRDVPNMEM